MVRDDPRVRALKFALKLLKGLTALNKFNTLIKTVVDNV